MLLSDNAREMAGTGASWRSSRRGTQFWGFLKSECWAILLMTLRVSTELTQMRDLAEPLLYIKNLYK